jgi:hypothetical protein
MSSCVFDISLGRSTLGTNCFALVFEGLASRGSSFSSGLVLRDLLDVVADCPVRISPCSSSYIRVDLLERAPIASTIFAFSTFNTEYQIRNLPLPSHENNDRFCSMENRRLVLRFFFKAAHDRLVVGGFDLNACCRLSGERGKNWNLDDG